MGKVLMSGGGGGGTGSDELTATALHVLEGYSYVGSDTDDEAHTGTMKNLSGRATITHASDNITPVILGDEAFTTTNSDGVQRVEIRYQGDNGYISSNTLFGISFSRMAEVLGVEAAKMLNTETILGIQGTIGSKAAATYYATTTDQTISAGQYLGGAQTIKKLTQTNLTAANILKGKTITINNGNANVWSVAGSLAVTSAISFSATAQSDSVIRISWTNPSKGPWEGVEIRMSTSGNPGVSGGTQTYKGKGNSTTASGSNYVDITGLSPGTTYYFTCTSYATGLGNGASYNVNTKTQNIITSSTRTDTVNVYYMSKDAMFQNTPSIKCWTDRSGYVLLYGHFANKSYNLKIGTNVNSTTVSFWKSGTTPTSSSGYYWNAVCYGEDHSSESVTWSGTFQANTNCIKFSMDGKDPDGNSNDLRILSFTIDGIDMMSNLRSVMGV